MNERNANPRRSRSRSAADDGAAAGPKAAEGARIAKVLARAGIASRREAERLIAEGAVAVNGRTIDSPALNVTESDRVTVHGWPLPAAEPPRLWLYHKPTGLVTSARDEKGRPTVFERLPPDMPRVVSVGRLDLNSEGLLLLTNDGALKRRLELPSTGWLRRYRVRVNGTPGEEMLAPLRAGITVEGERFQPMQVTLDRQQGANAWLTIGLREGRNREIRRALAAVGLIVNRLIRVGYGPFKLGDLAPGAVSEVRPRVLRDQLGLTIGVDDAPPPPAAAPRGARPASTGRRAGAKAASAPRDGGTRDGGTHDRGPRSRGTAAKAASERTGGPSGERPKRGRCTTEAKTDGQAARTATKRGGRAQAGPSTTGAAGSGGKKPRGGAADGQPTRHPAGKPAQNAPHSPGTPRTPRGRGRD